MIDNTNILFVVILAILILLFIADLIIIFKFNYRFKNYFYSDENWIKNRTVFHLISLGRIFLRCFLVLLLVLSLFDGVMELLLSKTISYIVTFNLIIKFFVIYSIQLEKSEYKKIQNRISNQPNYSESIYTWLGGSVIQDKNITSLFVKTKAGNVDFKNLKKVRHQLLREYGDDVNDFHLLKGYLETHHKSGYLEQANKIITTILMGCFTLLIRSIGSSEPVKEFLKERFGSLSSVDLVTYYTNFLDFALFVGYGVIALIFIIDNFSRDKRRIGVIISVLDNIIYEKENK